MLNWIEQVMTNANAVEGVAAEEFYLGFESVLPAEILTFLSGKLPVGQQHKTRKPPKADRFGLDEHELAMG